MPNNLQKIPGSPAFAINPTYGRGRPSLSPDGFTYVTDLTAPSTGGPQTGYPPSVAIPRRYPQLAGLAGTPGGQPVDFGTGLSITGGGGPVGSTGGAPTSSGSGTDPISTVADAFLAALGSAGTPDSTSGNAAPTILYPQPTDSGGGMNVKTIAVVAVIALAAWFVWKKWGKSAAS